VWKTSTAVISVYKNLSGKAVNHFPQITYYLKIGRFIFSEVDKITTAHSTKHFKNSAEEKTWDG
jgi:SpoU rRNA methylase family enzyme